MAVIQDLAQSYDQSTANDYDIAMGVHMIDPVETPLQLMLPKRQVGAVQTEWLEDELTGINTSLAITVSDTTGVSITVASGDGTDKFPTDLGTYKVIIRVDQEYMLATAESSDVMTVTRGYGSTTPATHAVDAVVYIVSQIETEGADAKSAVARPRSRPSNYVQTFSRTIKTSGVQEAVRHLGGVGSELGYQIGQRSRELAKELERTLIFGVASAAGNATTARTMAGLWKLIVSNRTSDSGSVDTDAIETDIRTCWTEGGNPNLILTTGKLAQDLANLYADRIRTEIVMQVGGAVITSIVNPLSSGPIYILPHRLLAAGEYYMLDLGRIDMGYIRPFFLKAIAEDGDYIERWIGGDYVLRMMNEKAHAYRYGFS